MTATATVDTIWTAARLATMAADRPGLGLVDDGLIAARDGRIVWVGQRAERPAGLTATREIDCGGRWITPGLIDCHTHLIHGGNRADEFEKRLAGVSYADIARAGGGIAATVAATRAASEDDLVATALPRLDRLLADGVTTVEIKSGYALDLAGEARMLRAARRLGQIRDVEVVTTFLGAHAIAPELAGDAEAHVDRVIAMIPALAAEGLIDAVDAFCETIAFSPAQTARVFAAARAHGLPVKLHADQLSDSDGAALAASFGALSADHLEWTTEAGAAAMAAAGTVAVLLPGAFFVLRETRKPPIDAFRRAGVGMAVATDYNPGTSPLTSPLLAAAMAATLFGLTVPEALLGVTRHAARALGRLDTIGTLEAGKACDLAVWSIDTPAELVQGLGALPLHARIRRGR
ncbi:imidazolonepropionase [Siculibacillus lacustris]|uniref:Imidazolonepropionase n=1 Tax=Siculibacillus lacustris TaxID=1549641 RepID=A0A4Q9VXC1_9HYPH|nr:imidazolonepropionase [Siculibacillus lacustris]TBW41040.1 imidazolonepropionase [Siculibacillus lacustris]